MKRLLPALFSVLLALPAIGQTSTDRPIHDAARAGSGDDVRKLLKADPKQRDVRTELGSTPLHLAAMNPDTSVSMSMKKRLGCCVACSKTDADHQSA
jgi:hypothetical protein